MKHTWEILEQSLDSMMIFITTDKKVTGRIMIGGENRKAHAELILRAVNSHDELVEALKQAENEAVGLTSMYTEFGNESADKLLAAKYANLAKRWGLAIAKAKGGSK